MDKSMRPLHCEAGTWDFHISQGLMGRKSVEHQGCSVRTLGKGFFSWECIKKSAYG